MQQEYAPAKVNLFLDVLNRRPDGYHNLGTLFQTIDAGDFLFGKKTADSQIVMRYNEPQEYPLEKDLVYKAALLLREKCEISFGAELYLEKKMPLGAGLGGGSADAAAALRLLNKIWELKLPYETLEQFGKELGADVPFLVRGGTAFAEGIGERLFPITLDKEAFQYTVLVATPHCAVPTKEAYAGVVPSGNARYENFKANFNGTLQFDFYNKFEESVLEKFPLIAEMKNKFLMCGATKALMSGSGASVFGIFESENRAHAAAEQLKSISRYIQITRFLPLIENKNTL